MMDVIAIRHHVCNLRLARYKQHDACHPWPWEACISKHKQSIIALMKHAKYQSCFGLFILDGTNDQLMSVNGADRARLCGHT